jgi:ubiquinone/menaquinone biosynthesis C-methylase UbiE
VSTQEVAAAFDEISAVYDTTREPIDAVTLDRLAAELRARGVRTVLEVGVGTGRVAAPLADRGFEVAGLDVSRRMLALAHRKGLSRLVRGDAYRLPFCDDAFDTTLFVHVLHLLDDAATALDEAIRVGRQGASALVHPAAGDGIDRFEGSELDPRRIVYRYLAQEGLPTPDRSGGPRTRERRLLTEIPPERLTLVNDREVTEPLAKRIDMLERRGSRHTLRVPPELLKRATEAARAEVGHRTITYRRREALATWSNGPYRPRAPA